MNRTILIIFVLFANLSGQAIAFTPMPLKSDGTPNIATILSQGVSQTYLAGSSAITPFLEQALRTNCTGTVFKYLTADKGSLAYVCSKADTFSGVTQPFLVMHKRDGGDSLNGIRAASGQTLLFIDQNSMTTVTACSVPVNSVSTCSGGALTTTARISEANFIDIEPIQFSSQLNGGVANTPGIAFDDIATEIFGIAVTLNLRNAMQEAMLAAHVLDTSCFVGSETEACMPNLTTPQLTSIFANFHVTDWDNAMYDKTFPDSIYQNATAFPTNSSIHICSGTAGSGTLAAFNIKFEDAPCNGLVNEAIQAASVRTISQEPFGTFGGGKFYHSLPANSNIEDCLVTLNNGPSRSGGPTFSWGEAVAGATTPEQRWGIGILGINHNATGALPYRFIKIDNASPSAHNVAEGRYRYWTEFGLAGPRPTDFLAINIVSQLGDAARIPRLNITQTWGGITGLLGLAVGGNPPTNTGIISPGSLTNAAFDSDRPVNPYTHATGTGASLSHCRVPIIPNGARAMPVFYPPYI